MQGFSCRAAVLAVLVAAAPSAQADEALELAKRLVVSSGLAVQLKSFPRQMEQEDIVRGVAARLTVGEMRRALLWLETDTGRRMARAEELASEYMTPQTIQDYAEGLKRRPPSAKRSALIAGLIAATKPRDANDAVTAAAYAYTYRDLGDAELAAYLDFNRSNSGVRYNDAMMSALAEALAN